MAASGVIVDADPGGGERAWPGSGRAGRTGRAGRPRARREVGQRAPKGAATRTAGDLVRTLGDIAARASGTAFGLETLREVVAEPGGTIHVDDAALLFRGDYARSGPDLVISGDGHRLVVHDYFALDHRPRLVAPNGASLDGSVVAGLVHAGTGDVTAQAGPAPTSDASAAIGRVQKVTGSATVVRNGVTVALHVGDLVYKGDAVQTDAASSLSVSFLDGTLFNLSAGARMLLSDLVYQASGTGNSALFNLVQGSITFVAGQVAKTGDMKVGTPVATMGIRGTAVHVTIEADNGTTTFSVMTEPDGHTGRFDVYDRNDPTRLLFTVSDPGTIAVVRPDGPYQVVFEQLPKPPVDAQTEAAIVQLLFRTIAESPRLPVFQGPSTGGGAGSSTAPNLILPQPDIQTPTLPSGPNLPPSGPQHQQGTPGGGGSGTPNRTDDPSDNQAPIPPRTQNDPAPPLALQPQTVTVAQDAALVASSASQGVLGAAAAATVRIVGAHAGADETGPDVMMSADTLLLHGRYGTLVLAPDGTYVYLADHAAALAAGQHGSDVFSYRAEGPGGASSAATLTIDVVGINDAPVVSAPVQLAAASGARTITAADLLANASDVDGDALSVMGLRIAQGGGTLTALDDGSYRYVPASPHGSSEPVILAYTVSDGHGGSVAQTAQFSVPLSNAAPVVSSTVALSDSAEDTSRIIMAAALLAGATDADGDALSVSGLHVASGGGTLTDLGDGRYRYDPAHDANGPVVLGYTVSDGYGGSLAQTARFAVTPVNDAPTVASSVTLADSAEDTPRAITAAQLLAGASDIDGDALSVSGLHIVSGGGTIASNSLGGYRYTPAHDANGPVVLGYTIEDGHGGSVAQTAGFTVTPVNDAPTVSGSVILADSAEDTPRTITAAQLLAGASDVDGDALSVSGLHVVSGGGTITVLGDGSYRYAPAQDANGPVVLGYAIEDGHGGSVAQSAGFTLTPVNDAPVLTLGPNQVRYTEDDPALAVASDIALSDVDSRMLSGASVRIGAGFHAGQDVLGVSLPDGGSISASYDAQTGVLVLTGAATLAAYLSALASVTYANTSEAPSGDTRRLGFSVTDDAGALSATVTRDVIVIPVNDAPTPHDDNAFVSAGSSVVLDVLANDTDPEGDALSLASVGAAGHGRVSLNDDGTVTYTPADGYAGPDSFTYVVKDTGGLTSQATVDIVVGYSAHKSVGTDVFLQGAYMEIGVSGSGSLGSASNAPTGFHPQGSSAISFVIDTNGWGSGTTPTSNDVTLPGTPEDAIVVGYDGKSFANSERTGVVQFAAKTVDTSSGGHLQATTVGLTAADGLQVTQVIDLDPNASYFSTTVTLTNRSATETLHDARFMRSFDPDQDAVFYGDYSTDNDVLANPTGGGGAAIVQALGTHSGVSVNLVSFESGARASADAFTNHNAYAPGVYDSPVDPNGQHADVGIAMDMDFGDLAPGQSVTRTFYTTLNTRSGANDLIIGTAGADTIDGKGGDDIIIGLGGDDVLTGGSGSDTFVFLPSGNDGRTHAALNSPVITDFTAGADVLQFDHTIFATSEQALAHTTQSGTDVQIAWDADGGHTVLTLRNLQVADLHLRDVHIV